MIKKSDADRLIEIGREVSTIANIYNFDKDANRDEFPDTDRLVCVVCDLGDYDELLMVGYARYIDGEWFEPLGEFEIVVSRWCEIEE